MARRRAERLGRLYGTAPDGSDVVVSVLKAGRDYRIGYEDDERLCHPSVRSIEACKREVLTVFHVHADHFGSL